MKSVLLVEPDVPLAATMRHFFEKQGFHVRIATNAQTALIAADTKRPDVVVLEIAMPKHNGLSFLQEFQTYDDWMSVPVVIYSHIPREDTGLSASEWQKQGVAAYCYKPTVTLQKLSRYIRETV